MVTHEKPNVITIDEIREQIINDVDIKPYCSPYKIYIVANAELMNPQAQNALLKTCLLYTSYMCSNHST